MDCKLEDPPPCVRVTRAFGPSTAIERTDARYAAQGHGDADFVLEQRQHSKQHRLAARGVRFDSAHAQYTLCNPSRVSFLSGRRPETSGVYILGTPARTALPEAVMLPQLFRQNGYFTAGAGKVFHSVKMSDAASWDRYEDGEGEDAQEKAAIKSRYGGGDGRPAWHVLDGDGSKTRDGLNSATIRSLLREKIGRAHV